MTMDCACTWDDESGRVVDVCRAHRQVVDDALLISNPPMEPDPPVTLRASVATGQIFKLMEHMAGESLWKEISRLIDRTIEDALQRERKIWRKEELDA